MFDKNRDGAKKIAAETRGIASGIDIVDHEEVGKAIAPFESEAGPTDTRVLAAVAGHDERGQEVRAALIGGVAMKRAGQPQDIPGAVCFLASNDASFITGQTISVSGRPDHAQLMGTVALFIG